MDRQKNMSRNVQRQRPPPKERKKKNWKREKSVGLVKNDSEATGVTEDRRDKYKMDK